MSWQQYATYDPILPVNQAFPGGFAQGRDVPISQMPAGMGFENAGGGLSMGQVGGMLNLANMFLGQSAIRNTMGSMDQAQRTAGLFGDIGTGRDYHAAESDLERQMRVAQWAPKFQVNDPFERQLAGKYALGNAKTAFDAFVA